MSIDRCTKCGSFIDTDFAPEVYREELDYECVCDPCCQILEDEHGNNRQPQLERVAA